MKKERELDLKTLDRIAGGRRATSEELNQIDAWNNQISLLNSDLSRTCADYDKNGNISEVAYEEIGRKAAEINRFNERVKLFKKDSDIDD